MQKALLERQILDFVPHFLHTSKCRMLRLNSEMKKGQILTQLVKCKNQNVIKVCLRIKTVKSFTQEFLEYKSFKTLKPA